MYTIIILEKVKEKCSTLFTELLDQFVYRHYKRNNLVHGCKISVNILHCGI